MHDQYSIILSYLAFSFQNLKPKVVKQQASQMKRDMSPQNVVPVKMISLRVQAQSARPLSASATEAAGVELKSSRRSTRDSE